MNNKLTNTRIEFHILQSFPVTCLNRDDVGAPKTAVVGGVTRARVSSQCWKRQVRMELQDLGVKLAVRTKNVEKMISESLIAIGATNEQAQDCAKHIAGELVDDTLLFLSYAEATAFAELAKQKDFVAKDIALKDITKLTKKVVDKELSGLDIALFGRMVAKAADMNVEAAASFNHAISTHKINNEVEFFTALDDRPEEQGSAHMGSLEYNSGTYYRYVSLDLGQLVQSLGEESQDLGAAIAAFTKALFMAVPSARQTTQSGACPWEFAKVYVRKGQRLQVPFETAVKAKDGGYLRPSIDALKDYLDTKEKLSGSLFGKIASYEWGEQPDFTIDHLVSALQGHVV